MEPDKNNTPVEDEKTKDEQAQTTEEPTNAGQDAPADALSRTPDDLEEEAEANAAAHPENAKPSEPTEKDLPFVKRVLRKVNVYFLIFILVVVVAGVIAAVTYFNSQKPADEPDIAGQTLTTEALKQLANTDASVGNTSQTLTIQGNAIIAGETLARGNLNVAGNLQTGGNITAPGLTISGNVNLGSTQINSLQVATNASIQGATTLRDLNVSGSSTFSGSITASQVTVSRLIMSGNAVLEIPNHVSFTGASPNRTANAGVLGSGGTLSVSGSDTAGTININTGGVTAPGCFGRIVFQQPYTKQPHVLVTPVGSPAGALQFYVERSTTGFNICSANAAPNNQSFGFDYFVTF